MDEKKGTISQINEKKNIVPEMSEKSNIPKTDEKKNIVSEIDNWDVLVQKSRKNHFTRDVLPILLACFIIFGTAGGLFIYYYFYTDILLFDYLFHIIEWTFISIPIALFIVFIIRKMSWKNDKCFNPNGMYKYECYKIITLQDQQKAIKKQKE